MTGSNGDVERQSVATPTSDDPNDGHVMHTTLRVEGANCSFCFNDTLDHLRGIDGVHNVRGSIGESCIEVDHIGLSDEVFVEAVASRLHGVEMYANEIRMTPLAPTATSTPCIHRTDLQHG